MWWKSQCMRVSLSACVCACVRVRARVCESVCVGGGGRSREVRSNTCNSYNCILGK